MFSLYVWPGKWNLPSVDAQCLAAIFYLQLTFPGRFELVECTNPDASPTGQLPYLVHEGHAVSPLSSIVAYLAGFDETTAPTAAPEDDIPIKPSLDASLSPVDRAKSVAWTAHVDAQLGDLVLWSFYGSETNYRSLTVPTIASFLSVPQVYYVPGRLREMYRPRLQSGDLWDTADDKDEPSKRAVWARVPSMHAPRPESDDSPEKVARTFAKEKILERARTTFDLLTALVPEGSFMLKESPTTFDVHLASHVLLILHAPLPNPLLKTLLLESYHSLVDHAFLVRTIAFPSQPLPLDSPISATFNLNKKPPKISLPFPPITPLEKPSLTAAVHLVTHGLAQSVRNLRASLLRSPENDADDIEDEEGRKEAELEKQLAQWRWVWFAAAAVGFVAYQTWLNMELIQIMLGQTVNQGEGEDGDEYEDDDQDEDE